MIEIIISWIVLIGAIAGITTWIVVKKKRKRRDAEEKTERASLPETDRPVFPTETAENARLCDRAAAELAKEGLESALELYLEAAENGSARGNYFVYRLLDRTGTELEAPKEYYLKQAERGSFPYAYVVYAFLYGFVASRETPELRSEPKDGDVEKVRNYLRKGEAANDPLTIALLTELTAPEEERDFEFADASFVPDPEKWRHYVEKLAGLAKSYPADQSAFWTEAYFCGIPQHIACAAFMAEEYADREENWDREWNYLRFLLGYADAAGQGELLGYVHTRAAEMILAGKGCVMELPKARYHLLEAAKRLKEEEGDYYRKVAKLYDNHLEAAAELQDFISESDNEKLSIDWEALAESLNETNSRMQEEREERERKEELEREARTRAERVKVEGKMVDDKTFRDKKGNEYNVVATDRFAKTVTMREKHGLLEGESKVYQYEKKDE